MRHLTLLSLMICAAHAEAPDHDGHDHRHQGHPAELAGSAHHPHLAQPDDEDSWFRIHPHLSAAVALGGSTSEKNLTLIEGGHAPVDDGFNLQGIEVGAVMEFGDALSFHGNYNVWWDRYDHWGGEWEDAYLAYALPHGLTVRGGQFITPFGYANQLHLHDRDFVDPSISVIRLLGEDGLITQGGDLAIHLPGLGGRTSFRFGYGGSPEHSHGGKREERREGYETPLEHDGHEEEHDGHEEEHEEHGHSHGLGGNGIYDPEDAYLADGYFFSRLESRSDVLPGVDRIGLSLAAGNNGFKRSTWVLGADIGGSTEIHHRELWWRGEAFYRYVNAYDHSGRSGHFDEGGIYASCGYQFLPDWTAAARLEWASGNHLAGLERRVRASANLSWISRFGPKADLHTRLQYSLDDLGGYGTDHSVWLQFVLNLGAAEHGHDH